MKAHIVWAENGPNSEFQVLMLPENENEADRLRQMFLRMSADDAAICTASAYSEIKGDNAILAVASGNEGEVLTDKYGENATIEMRLFRS